MDNPAATSSTGKRIKDLPLLPSKTKPQWRRHQRPGGDSVLQYGEKYHDKKTLDRLIAKVNQEYKGLSLAEKVAKFKELLQGKEGNEQSIGLRGRGMGQPDYFQKFREFVQELPQKFDDFVPGSVKSEGDNFIQAGKTTGYNIDGYGVGKADEYSKMMREGSNRILYHQYVQHPDHGEEILRRLNSMGMTVPYAMATSATSVLWDESWPDEPEIETQKVGDLLVGRSTQYVISFQPRDEKEADKLIQFFERNAKHGQKDSIPHSWQVPDIRSSFNGKVDEFEKNVLNIKRMGDYELLLLKKEDLDGFDAHNIWLNSDLSKFIKSLAILVTAPLKGRPIIYMPKFLAKAMPWGWQKPGHKYIKREMKGGKWKRTYPHVPYQLTLIRRKPQSLQYILAKDRIVSTDELYGGINETRLITLGQGRQAVFKPATGEDEGVRDGIQSGTYWIREVVAYQVAKLLAMEDLVPVTVEREIDGEIGSIQEFKDSELHPAHQVAGYGLDKLSRKDLERAVSFDFILGNTDRHAGNFLTDGKGKLILIDHGLILSTETERLRIRLMAPLKDTPVAIRDSIKSKWKSNWETIERILDKNGIEKEAIRLARLRFNLFMESNTYQDLRNKLSKNDLGYIAL